MTFLYLDLTTEHATAAARLSHARGDHKDDPAHPTILQRLGEINEIRAQLHMSPLPTPKPKKASKGYKCKGCLEKKLPGDFGEGKEGRHDQYCLLCRQGIEHRRMARLDKAA